MNNDDIQVRRGQRPERHDPEVDGPFWSAGRVAVTFVMLSIVAFWLWAFSGSFGFPWAPTEVNPDEMADQTLVSRADNACGRAKADIAKLPFASTVGSPAERADLVHDGNVIVARLVDDLGNLNADNEEDQFAYDEWLDDWQTYLGDRERHVERLRTEGDVRFLLTDIGAQHVTVAIDGFARVNDMNNCIVPLDV